MRSTRERLFSIEKTTGSSPDHRESDGAGDVWAPMDEADDGPDPTREG